MTRIPSVTLPSSLVLRPTCLAYIYLSQTSPIHMKLVTVHASEDSRVAGDMCVPFKLCTVCIYYLDTINKPANKYIGYV